MKTYHALTALLFLLASSVALAQDDHDMHDGHNMDQMHQEHDMENMHEDHGNGSGADSMHDGGHAAGKAGSHMGKPGMSAKVSRTIAVTMDDNLRFTPGTIKVKAVMVGDYSLTTPYEWYSDNALAYLLVTLEEAALAGLEPGPAAEARGRITAALRAVWPGFNHRNIAPDVRAYFRETLPIAPADRDELVLRYLQPILAGPPVPGTRQ